SSKPVEETAKAAEGKASFELKRLGRACAGSLPGGVRRRLAIWWRGCGLARIGSTIFAPRAARFGQSAGRQRNKLCQASDKLWGAYPHAATLPWQGMDRAVPP